MSVKLYYDGLKVKIFKKMKIMLNKNTIIKESITLDDDELAEKCDAILANYKSRKVSAIR